MDRKAGSKSIRPSSTKDCGCAPIMQARNWTNSTRRATPRTSRPKPTTSPAASKMGWSRNRRAKKVCATCATSRRFTARRELQFKANLTAERIGRGERILNLRPLGPANSVESAANSLVWYRLRIRMQTPVAPMHPSDFPRGFAELNAHSILRVCVALCLCPAKQRDARFPNLALFCSPAGKCLADDAGGPGRDHPEMPEEHWLLECRDHRVPVGRGRQDLLHRDEHAHPGGALCDRNGDRDRPGEGATADCRGREAFQYRHRSGGGDRARDRVPH